VHEFFEVIVKVDGRAEEAQVHQALGFTENGGVIVAQGLHHVPARVVLGHRPLRGNAHTRDAENASSDADVQLREGAPELPCFLTTSGPKTNKPVFVFFRLQVLLDHRFQTSTLCKRDRQLKLPLFNHSHHLQLQHTQEL
jgi:hypothetical protein